MATPAMAGVVHPGRHPTTRAGFRQRPPLLIQGEVSRDVFNFRGLM